MKLSSLLLVVLLSTATAFGVSKYATPVGSETAKKETAFERVERTGTLRCGYILWMPFLAQDPGTKQMSGIVSDFINAITNELGWKVEWVEEVGWGTFQEGLKTGRYDAMCTPVYETGLRAKISLMTNALYNDGLYMFGRADDTRMDTSLESLNDPSITLAMVEGEAVSIAIKKNIFPRAKLLETPQMMDQGQYLMTVATGKADAGFASPYAVYKYNEGSGGKIKLVGGKPVSVYGNTIAVKPGEYDLKFALDSAINALMKNGTAKRIIEAHKQEGFLLPTEY